MAIHYQMQNHIALITIDRYERRNAIDGVHAQELLTAWKRFRDDPDMWVAIITGVNDIFCAGGDLKQMGDISEETRLTGSSKTQKQFTDENGAYFTLRGLDLFKPIIAAVNGGCHAGGMELLGGTDIRIASENAVFSVTEPRRGLIAAGGTTSRLPRQLAWPAAMEILLTAGHIRAQRAFQMGLINEVVPSDNLMESAYRWAEEICKNAPLAVQNTKKSALASLRVGSLDEAYAVEDECSLIVRATEDATEGPRAFMEKRQPVWRGR